MAYVFRIIAEFAMGVRDSLRFQKVIEFILISKPIKETMAKTFFINGVLFLGSMVILKLISESFFVSNLRGSSFAELVFKGIYYALYLVPLYIISFIMNTFYYADIAAEGMSIEKNKFNNKGIIEGNIDLAGRLYNELINGLLLVFFLLQSFIISWIPVIGGPLQFISQAFTYAFFCFTYKWGTDQKNFTKIMAFFEKYFFYFAGFGFVYAAITYIFPGFIGSGVYALLFPIFLLLAVKAAPPKDLEFTETQNFVQYMKGIFDKKEMSKIQIAYDDIESFNYDDYSRLQKQQVGIFTFPLTIIKLVGDWLHSRLQKYGILQ